MTQEDKEDKLYRCTACKLEFYQEEKYPSLRCPLCESMYVEEIPELKKLKTKLKV